MNADAGSEAAPDDGRDRSERNRLRLQLVVIVVGLVLLPVAIATHSRVLGGAVIAGVIAISIYVRIDVARSLRRQR